VRISVALAARNAEPFIGELLESLARQSQPPHELVVWDDASEDSTPELVEAFAGSAPFPVRLIGDGRWRGHVESFLHAARECEGDAIAFCDADDVWLERKLETCGRALERQSTSLVLHTTRVVDAALGDLGRDWPAIATTRIAPRLGLTGLDVDAPGMAMVFRPELLDAADFDSRPPSRFGLGRQMLQDEWVLFVAGVLGEVQLIAEPLVLYRQHESNDSGGWVDRTRQRTLRPALDTYRQIASHTAACADYLEHAHADDDGVAARLAEGARHYRRAAENWSLRISLYAAPDRRSRARLVKRLMASHAYTARAGGGFGRAALGKDIAAGVALRVPANHGSDR
jgi:glycosyltransferase involved in cell wall biosynthesis